MELIINKVATCGCEILKESKIVAWSVDRAWAEVIKKALEEYLGKEGK